MRYPGIRKTTKAALSPAEERSLLGIAPEEHLDKDGHLQPYATIAILLRRVVYGLGELEKTRRPVARKRAARGEKRVQRDLFFFPGELRVLIPTLAKLGYEGRGAIQRVLRDLAVGALAYKGTKKGLDWVGTCREYAINEGLPFEENGAVECPLCDELQDRPGAECCDTCRGAVPQRGR